MNQEKQFADGTALLAKGGSLLEGLLKKLAETAMIGSRVDNARLDEHQVVAYRIAVLYSQWQAAEVMLEYTRIGEVETALGIGFCGLTVQTMREQLSYCALQLNHSVDACNQFFMDAKGQEFVQQTTGSTFARETLALMERLQTDGSYDLGEEHSLMVEMFRSFAENKVKPVAEEIHRKDLLIPEELIEEAKRMDCFGLSIPVKYGGFQEEPDNIGIAVVTEELSRGALIIGSLITRPDILSKAILKGGTEEQKNHWLPQLASGESLCAVAVTEPNFGSDVAGITTTAKPVDNGWVINGVKTWCTFAGRANLLMVLCRTEEDLNLKHKGLSILIAEKPVDLGHDFEHTHPQGGKISGRAIGTIGYRGMHSYEISFENYFVPAENLIGLEEGRGKGFYMQMAGFSGGRLQTAARAVGLMQAAYEASKQYAKDREIFGQALYEYAISQTKIAHIAMTVQACRQLTLKAAKLMNAGEGQMEASMIKLFACRQAEWITREALQLHGGMGYAEEYAVSRYFQDARVLSIFEGAEEVLALRVVIPALLKEISTRDAV